MSRSELEFLRKVYLKAEVDIINEISRLRQRGLIDYHAVVALERVQKILLSLQDTCWRYVPRMIEREFYVNHPELYTRYPKTALEHLVGYQNAFNLSVAEYDVAQRLAYALLSDLERAGGQVMADLTNYLVGRNVGDIYRTEGLEAVLKIRATGVPLQAKEEFINNLRQQGVTAFIDKAGRKWSLHTYANMVTRSVVKQAGNVAILTKDPEQDLFMISKIGSTCPVCAPLEGRVYSKSGTHPVFPPLADAYGKKDPDGPDTLENTWMTIHPNCLHSLVPWTPLGKTDEQIKEIERFSNPRTNPYSKDPRSEAQIKAYRDNQKAREKWLADFKEFENMRLAIPDKVPKTFQTFQKHKLADDDKYKAWVQAYKGTKK